MTKAQQNEKNLIGAEDLMNEFQSRLGELEIQIVQGRASIKTLRREAASQEETIAGMAATIEAHQEEGAPFRISTDSRTAQNRRRKWSGLFGVALGKEQTV